MSGTATGIEKLHIAIMIQTELQPLRGVVHLCRDHRVRHLQLGSQGLIDLHQRTAFGEALRDTVVLTAYLQHKP